MLILKFYFFKRVAQQLRVLQEVAYSVLLISLFKTKFIIIKIIRSGKNKNAICLKSTILMPFISGFKTKRLKTAIPTRIKIIDNKRINKYFINFRRFNIVNSQLK